jgi:hypothetical protein
VPSAQNQNPILITILATSEHSDSAILPKAIPVKALNTAKRNSGFCQIDALIRVPKAIGVNLSHIVLVIRHFVLIFSFSGMILF